MRWTHGLLAAALLGGVVASAPGVAFARGLDIELSTDRGDDAVYQPGQALEVRARASDDAYLLVYEIDSEGAVHALFPGHGNRGYIEGRRTYVIPPTGSDVELVVEGPVGQGYIVGIASGRPFRDLPWYLRPVDPQADEVGYRGERGEEEGVTQQGRIVGDPFVAMERIRRRVLEDPNEADGFGTAYVSYYVHDQVRYPRYLCYDCHRPNQWAWWDGFDPYYTSCSAFDFRVNWGWTWGPNYWCGYVPYYYYVYRPDCPPRYRVLPASRTWYSSWDGYRRWRTLWGSRLTRIKSDPPSGYVPPTKYRDGGVWGDGSPAPPGFIRRNATREVRGGLTWVPRGSDRTRDAVRPNGSGSPRPVGDPIFRPRRPNDAWSPGTRAPDRPWRVLRPDGGATPQGRDRVEQAPVEKKPVPMGRDMREVRPERPRDSQPKREAKKPDPPRKEQGREEKPGSGSDHGDGSRSRPWRTGR